MAEEHRGAESSETAGHEPDVLNVRAVAWGTAGLALLLVATVALVAGVDAMLGRLRGPDPEPGAGLQPAPPTKARVRLDADQPRELRELRAAERRALNSYGWVDEQEGTARIPIDRAIDLLAEQGLPIREHGDESTEPTGEPPEPGETELPQLPNGAAPPPDGTAATAPEPSEATEPAEAPEPPTSESDDDPAEEAP